MAYIITHNSPSVGYVSWQDLHMQYNGSAYAIANGNTDKVYIWWELADPYVLKSSNTYPTLGAADALVLLNKNGTAFLVPGSTVLDGSLIVPGTICNIYRCVKNPILIAAIYTAVSKIQY